MLKILNQFILTAPDRSKSDYFGCSVAISKQGSKIAIGAYGAVIDNKPYAGKVYIFNKDIDNIWYTEAIIHANNPEQYSGFGDIVSMSDSGDILVVGAHCSSCDIYKQAGKVYVYRKLSDNWIEDAVLTASDTSHRNHFGYVVGIDGTGTRAVIGALQAPAPSYNSAGAVYIYSRSGTTWTQEAGITSSGTDIGFGGSCSIDGLGNRVVIGAYQSSVSSKSAAGRAYVFTRSGTNWTEETSFSLSAPIANDYLAKDCSINNDGNIIVLSCPGRDPSAINAAGAAYIYTRSGIVWTLASEISAIDKATGDNFSTDISISRDGNTIISGAPYADPSTLSNAGKIYIFS